MISNFIIPFLVFLVVLYGIMHKVDVYDAFIEGAKESFEMIFTMFPCMLGMILGINIFLKSGILDLAFKLLNPLLTLLKIPFEVIPMALMRPISGSTSLALLNNILKTLNPDSLIGKMASVIQGSTDTTFYVLTLYFGSIGIKKIRYALFAGLFADFIGIMSAIILSNLVFGC